MWDTPEEILNDLVRRRPELSVCRQDIQIAYEILLDCIKNDHAIFTCGNGGSAADAEHIVGELLKGFMLGRKLPSSEVEKIEKVFPNEGLLMANSMQQSLKAIALTSHPSFASAYLNDVDAKFIFAQQLYGLGRLGDVVICISTSGNSENILNVAKIAKVYGIKVIGLTGASGGKLRDLSDICICVPEKVVPLVQELHLPVYHALCAMLEIKLFKN